jgi:hypothetical protein
MKETFHARFDGIGLLFHLPLRCEKTIKGGGSGKLCDKCLLREAKTREKVADAGGNSLLGHQALLHGSIDEPIPYWSHIYDGPWYRLKVASGGTISEETMVKIKKAVDAIGTVVPAVIAVSPIVAPEAIKAVKTVKKVAKATKATKAKKEPAAEVPVLGIILNPKPIEVEETVEVEVEPITIDDVAYYIDRSKRKVYNKKCKYVGRLSKEGTIDSSFPDSDAGY